jgi:SMODS-associated NUDIX domain
MPTRRMSRDTTNEGLVLFVHGLGEDSKATWGNFEALISADKALRGFQVAYFSYPTLPFRLPFGRRYPGIQTLAQALATQIENRHQSFQEITLVCHSLGGLIGKQYLIDCISVGRPLRVKRALFYAVPNNGASLAAVGNMIAWRHLQLRQLCRDSDVIRSIVQAWERNHADSKIDVRYVVAALDRVVDEQSARLTWANEDVEVVVDRGHIDLVKPRDADDLSFLILKNHLRRTPKLSPGNAVRGNDAAVSPPRPATAQTAYEPVGELRIAVSAIVRIEMDGRFLLIRNTHRPESFAPFGGVYKLLPAGRMMLDQFSFRPQVLDADMKNDLRGFISSRGIEGFRNWLARGDGREAPIECIRRELREELMEVKLDAGLVPDDVSLHPVRTVTEGPEFIPALGCSQFRVFDVYELDQNAAANYELIRALVDQSSRSLDLLWVSAESAKRGRAPTGQVVAAHAPYLFGEERYRVGDPPLPERQN